MRTPKQYVKIGDRVRARDTGWLGTVTKTHNGRGEMLQSGGHQDARVRWDKNGCEGRTVLVGKNLEVVG